MFFSIRLKAIYNSALSRDWSNQRVQAFKTSIYSPSRLEIYKYMKLFWQRNHWKCAHGHEGWTQTRFYHTPLHYHYSKHNYTFPSYFSWITAQDVLDFRLRWWSDKFTLLIDHPSVEGDSEDNGNRIEMQCISFSSNISISNFMQSLTLTKPSSMSNRESIFHSRNALKSYCPLLSSPKYHKLYSQIYIY